MSVARGSLRMQPRSAGCSSRWSAAAGFTGRAPGGKSRWSGKERVPVPLEPVLVVEVSADHITGEHMRHGARLLRWRTDKPPKSCTMDQIR